MNTTIRTGKCPCGAIVVETAVMVTTTGIHIAICAVCERTVVVL